MLEVSWVHNLFLSLVFFQDIAARCSYNPHACGKKRERSLIRALLSRNAAIIGKLKSNYWQFACFSGLSYYFVRASYTRRIIFSNKKVDTVSNKRKFHFAFHFASRLVIRKTWIISGKASFLIPNFDLRYFKDYRVSSCHSIRKEWSHKWISTPLWYRIYKQDTFKETLGCIHTAEAKSVKQWTFRYSPWRSIFFFFFFANHNLQPTWLAFLGHT